MARPVAISLFACASLLVPASVGADPTSAPVIGAPTGTATVFVPKDTVIVVQTLEGLSSYAAHTGEKVEYVVTQDVVLDGYVIAKAGDSAEGQVLEAQQGEAPGYFTEAKGGDLRVTVDTVYNFCGDSVAMTFDRTEYRRRQGFLESNKDVQIIKGQKYLALVSRPQKVCGSPTTETPAPIPTDALPSATATTEPNPSPTATN